MVLDTSALLAILFAEPDAPAMVRAIAKDASRLLGAPTFVEAAAVMHARKGPAGEVALDGLLERLDIHVIDMTHAAAKLARLGYARFGKGVGDQPSSIMATASHMVSRWRHANLCSSRVTTFRGRTSRRSRTEGGRLAEWTRRARVTSGVTR